MPRDNSSLTGDLTRSRTFRRLARGGRRYAMPWLSLRRWRKRVLLVGAAMLSGLVAILFAIGAELAIGGHEQLMHISPWLSLVIAPAGFAAMAYLCRKYFPGTQGSGIPQTIAASITNDDKLRRSLLSPRILIGKILLTLGGLLSGATIGREGPSVQIGASVLNMLSGKKRGRIAPTRDLIIAGGAAGVAAAFNTPLGGIMFAIEELSRNRPFMANSMTLIAVIFAGLMSLATLGSYTYFGVTQASLAWPAAITPILVSGACGGLLGGLFTRLLIRTTRKLPGKIGVFARAKPIRFAAACGLATAIIGLLTAGLSYGTGYAEIKGALEGTSELPIYYGLAKAAAILLAFVSGIPGGLFAPALAVGAGVGTNVSMMFPDVQSTAVLALGMVAFLAGVTQSPITSFVIVMEMTANHSLLLPLMCASVIAHAFSRTVAPTPLYDAMAYAILRRHTQSRRIAKTLSKGAREAAEADDDSPAPAGPAPGTQAAEALSLMTKATETAVLLQPVSPTDASPAPAGDEPLSEVDAPGPAAVADAAGREIAALERAPLAEPREAVDDEPVETIPAEPPVDADRAADATAVTRADPEGHAEDTADAEAEDGRRPEADADPAPADGVASGAAASPEANAATTGSGSHGRWQRMRARLLRPWRSRQ